MLEADVVIVNKLGLHARAASKFIKLAKQYVAKIEIGYLEGELVNGKSIMQLMTLAAEQGSTLRLRIEGEDEQSAQDELLELVADFFGEGE